MASAARGRTGSGGVESNRPLPTLLHVQPPCRHEHRRCLGGILCLFHLLYGCIDGDHVCPGPSFPRPSARISMVDPTRSWRCRSVGEHRDSRVQEKWRKGPRRTLSVMAA